VKETSSEKRKDHDQKLASERASKDKFKAREQFKMEIGERVYFKGKLIKKSKVKKARRRM